MLRVYLFFLFSTLVYVAQSQVNDNLFAYINFDSCTSEDQLGFFNGINEVPLQCVCGFQESAAKFDGIQVIQMGEESDFLNNTITSDEFTLSLVLLTNRSNPAMTVFSVTEDCNSYGFELIYTPNIGVFNLRLTTNKNELIDIPFNDDRNSCWQYIVINRNYNKIDCIVNGELKSENQITPIPNFKSLGIPKIGGGGCSQTLFSKFRGLIDEVRVYNRVLSVATAKTISSHDRNNLSDNFQVVFKGNEYGVSIDTDCPSTISWTPEIGVSNPNGADVILSPLETTKYTASVNYEGCTQSDTILIKVIDESSINCSKLLLPNTFTPNGDQLNDTYGISTTYTIDDDCLFEIFDLHGGKVFSTTHPEGRWDGTFNGSELPTGVYIYKIKYKCGGENYSVSGSVNLIR